MATVVNSNQIKVVFEVFHDKTPTYKVWWNSMTMRAQPGLMVTENGQELVFKNIDARLPRSEL